MGDELQRPGDGISSLEVQAGESAQEERLVSQRGSDRGKRRRTEIVDLRGGLNLAVVLDTNL